MVESLNISRNIFLVGPMGVGKTTIGKQLAQKLNMVFHDSDKEIEERTGASISLIFELEGEEGFRRREHAIIDELSQLKRIILSTGGGAVVREENRQLLKARGWVIYLYASVEELLERTSHNNNRPLLKTENPRERIEQLLKDRQPLYKEVADTSVQTGNRTIHQVVRQILKRLERLEMENI